MLSWPHFFQADPSLLDAVEGLEPSKEKHQFHIDILPVSEDSEAILALILTKLSTNIKSLIAENGCWNESCCEVTDQPGDETDGQCEADAGGQGHNLPHTMVH